MLLELLPERLQKSNETAQIQRAIEKEVQKAIDAYDRLLLQLFVSSADEGLLLWEEMYGISPAGDISGRRSRIMSKMRGAGTTTAQMIKNVCESFYNGQVEIIEHFDQYSFDIVFLSSIGVPPRIDNMTAAIEEIKPAHLAYQYVITYRRHSELTAWGHEDLAFHTHQYIREGGELA